jgi:hypothetical protein
MGAFQKNHLYLAWFLQSLGCVLPLESGPNNLFAASPTALNSVPGASCPLMPNWKLLSRSVRIKAEVRSRVYWTNVLIDTKVLIDTLVQ